MILNIFKVAKKNESSKKLQEKEGRESSSRSLSRDGSETDLVSNEFTIIVPSDWEDSLQDELEYFQQKNDRMPSLGEITLDSCENDACEQEQISSQWTDADKETALNAIKEKIKQQESFLMEVKETIDQKVLVVASRFKPGHDMIVSLAMKQVLDLETKRDLAFRRVELLEELYTQVNSATMTSPSTQKFQSTVEAIMSISAPSDDLSQAEILAEATSRLLAISIAREGSSDTLEI